MSRRWIFCYSPWTNSRCRFQALRTRERSPVKLAVRIDAWLSLRQIVSRVRTVTIGAENITCSHRITGVTEKQFYFAYGSNMSTDRLRARIPEAAPVGRARWPGMRLVFNKVAEDGSGKANLIEDPDALAWGVVFRITVSDWTRLDAFEPGYARVPCNVTVDSGETLDAQVYLGVGSTRDTPPHDWYREHLVRGAIEHRFPAEIVRGIRALQRA